MTRGLAILLLAWVPFYGAALFFGRPRRAGAVLMGTALAAFVGSMCCVELRRHGVLAAAPGAVPVPPFGLHLVDLVRFAAVGAGGALAADIFLNRVGCGPKSAVERS